VNQFIIAFMFLAVLSSFGFSNLSYGQGAGTAFCDWLMDNVYQMKEKE